MAIVYYGYTYTHCCESQKYKCNFPGLLKHISETKIYITISNFGCDGKKNLDHSSQFPPHTIFSSTIEQFSRLQKKEQKKKK